MSQKKPTLSRRNFLLTVGAGSAATARRIIKVRSPVSASPAGSPAPAAPAPASAPSAPPAVAPKS